MARSQGYVRTLGSEQYDTGATIPLNHLRPISQFDLRSWVARHSYTHIASHQILRATRCVDAGANVAFEYAVDDIDVVRGVVCCAAASGRWSAASSQARQAHARMQWWCRAARTGVDADAVAAEATELEVITPAVANGGTDREST
jgi:hypothetical protein